MISVVVSCSPYWSPYHPVPLIVNTFQTWTPKWIDPNVLGFIPPAPIRHVHWCNRCCHFGRVPVALEKLRAAAACDYRVRLSPAMECLFDICWVRPLQHKYIHKSMQQDTHIRRIVVHRRALEILLVCWELAVCFVWFLRCPSEWYLGSLPYRSWHDRLCRLLAFEQGEFTTVPSLSISLLVGCLEHFSFFFHIILGIIIPTNVFQRGRSTTNQSLPSWVENMSSPVRILTLNGCMAQPSAGSHRKTIRHECSWRVPFHSSPILVQLCKWNG